MAMYPSGTGPSSRGTSTQQSAISRSNNGDVQQQQQQQVSSETDVTSPGNAVTSSSNGGKIIQTYGLEFDFTDHAGDEDEEDEDEEAGEDADSDDDDDDDADGHCDDMDDDLDDDLNDMDDNYCLEYSGVSTHDVDHPNTATIDVELLSSSSASKSRRGLPDSHAAMSEAVTFVPGGRSTAPTSTADRRFSDDLVDMSAIDDFDTGGGLRRGFGSSSGGFSLSSSQQQLVGGGRNGRLGLRWLQSSSSTSSSSLCRDCCRCRLFERFRQPSAATSTRSSCWRLVVSCVRSRPCLFFVYVILVLILLSSCVSLVLVGILVAEPFVRVSSFANTTCFPISADQLQRLTNDSDPNIVAEHPALSFPASNVVGNDGFPSEFILQTCSCGKGCNSKYRCLRIYVRYETGEERQVTSVLYEDETSLNRQVFDFVSLIINLKIDFETVHCVYRLFTLF